MRALFKTLQRASGLSNADCGRYLGISEGAVKDRRMGAFEPRRSELIALAVFGSPAEERAKQIIREHCEHEFNADGWCRVCWLERDTEKDNS